METISQTGRWMTRVAIATAALSLVAALAQPVRAMAEEVAPQGDAASATWAIGIFIAVWFIASLRVKRHRGRWRLGFSPAAVRTTAAGRSNFSSGGGRGSGGSSGGAGASGAC